MKLLLCSIMCLTVFLALALLPACNCDDDDDDDSGYPSDDDSSDDDAAPDDDDDDDNTAGDDDSADDDDDFSDDDDDAIDDDDDDATDDDDDDDDYVYASPHTKEGWAVGCGVAGSDLVGVIWHDQQGVWTEEVLPYIPNPFCLMAVHAVDSNNVWAVGPLEGAVHDEPLILHRDASGWHIETIVNPPLNDAGFGDIYMLDADSGWAVGYADAADGYCIAKYETGVWTFPFTTPIPEPIAFESVDSLGPAENYFAGMVTTVNGMGKLLSYDGANLTVWRTGTWNDAYSDVEFLNTNDGCFFYTIFNSGLPISSSVECYDGAGWNNTQIAYVHSNLYGLTTSPDGTFYLAGYKPSYFPAGTQPILMARTPSGWSDLPIGTGLDRNSAIYDIDFPADDLGFVVGQRFNQPYSFPYTLVLQYDGTDWKMALDGSNVWNTVFAGVSYLP